MPAAPSRGHCMTPDSRETLILKFARDRVIAHQSLFAHRHSDETPPFHDELTELWHSSAPRVLTLAFRGGGKSTLAEEALVLAAAMKLVRNVVIIGSNSDRANDRLRAIKHELETNELLVELYGDLRGPVWNEGRTVLANGVCIQAFGRGQALRGVKYHDARPDLCFVDDVEEEEHVRSPEARQETLRWFMTELVLLSTTKHAYVSPPRRSTGRRCPWCWRRSPDGSRRFIRSSTSIRRAFGARPGRHVFPSSGSRRSGKNFSRWDFRLSFRRNICACLRIRRPKCSSHR